MKFRWSLLILGLMSSAVHAADDPGVRWHNDVTAAWQASQQQGKPLLVFVTTNGCLPCARMKTQTYMNRQISSQVNTRFVALVVDASTPSPLLRDLAVNAFPATFVISPQAVILQRIDGYVTPEQLSARFSQLGASASMPLTTEVAENRTY